MTVTERELRDRIAHYKGLRRMAVDRAIVDMISRVIADDEERLAELKESGPKAGALSL